MEALMPRAPTHDVVDFNALWSLGEDLMAMGPVLTADEVDELAEEHGVPRSHAWMALSYTPSVQVKRTTDIAVAVCAARCQLWGAADLIDDLLTLSDTRRAAEKRWFDVVPRGCLNRCSQAPVATGMLPEGTVGFATATVEDVEELLATLEADAAG
jgi:NADH:ubiquinone oxidoreductase subunit E